MNANGRVFHLAPSNELALPACAPAALRALESWLFEAVTRDPGESTRGCARLDGRPAPARELVRGGSLAPEARVEIYRRAYAARLSECLADDYPLVQYALGAERFAALCGDFIRDCPPKSFSLNFYGAPFADYCGERPESWRLFARDLARFEWAVVEAIHASDSLVLCDNDLRGLTPDDWQHARFVPSGALRVLELSYPVHAFARAYYEDEAPGWPDAQPSAVALCRRGLDVYRVPLDPAARNVLCALLAGRSLSDALNTAARTSSSSVAEGELESLVLTAFRDWVSCGFFASILCAR